MGLVSASKAGEYLRGFASSQSTELGTWLAAAESVLHRWLRLPLPDDGVRSLETKAYTVYLDGPDSYDRRTLDLGLRPVSGTPTIGDDVDWDYDGNAIASSEWLLLADVGRIMLRPTATHAWSSSPRSIRVECSAGFDVDDDPDVVAAVVLQASHMWQYGHTEGVPNVTEDGTEPDDRLVPDRVMEMLGPYRIWEASLA